MVHLPTIKLPICTVITTTLELSRREGSVINHPVTHRSKIHWNPHRRLETIPIIIITTIFQHHRALWKHCSYQVLLMFLAKVIYLEATAGNLLLVLKTSWHTRNQLLQFSPRYCKPQQNDEKSIEVSLFLIGISGFI